MISKLVLIRHGEPQSRRLGETDAERPLTTRGLKALQREYPTLLAPLAGDLNELQIWSSEAVRARQTAEVVCDALGVDRDEIDYRVSLYAQDYDFFYGELMAADGVVVAVGHIPFMEEVACDLAGQLVSFTPGSIACLTVPDAGLERAELEWFARGPQA